MPRRKYTSGIYRIECLLSKKIYIGSSKNMAGRWTNHKSLLRNNKHANPYLQRAWNKYGSESFVFSIIEKCDVDILIERETFWVAHYNSTNALIGYNITIPDQPSLRKPGDNITKRIPKTIVVIETLTGKPQKYNSGKDVADILNIPYSRVLDVTRYWKNKKGKRSSNGYIFVYEEDYIEDFDYVNFKKKRVRQKGIKYKPRKPEIKPRKIRTEYANRILCRKPLKITNINTGKMHEVSMYKEAALIIGVHTTLISKKMKDKELIQYKNWILEKV